MFGGGFFNDFDNDPFFRSHNEMMQRMTGQFNDPFPSMFGNQPRALEGPSVGGHSRDPFNNMSLAMPGMLGGGMFGMNQMMANMNQMTGSMMNNPNVHSFSSSSVMSYSSDGRNPPRVYSAQRSTRQAPGGVREVNRAEHDSHTGVKKMSLDRQIGDRRHVMEKSQDLQSGEVEECEEYDNMDESDAPAFNSEWDGVVRQQHRGPQSHARYAIEDRARTDRRNRRHHRHQDDHTR